MSCRVPERDTLEAELNEGCPSDLSLFYLIVNGKVKLMNPVRRRDEQAMGQKGCFALPCRAELDVHLAP